MCGIAGRVNLFSQRPVDEASIAGMCAWLAHRGPDDEGVIVRGNVGFGHRRLAIIDLSAAGHQPMVSRSGRYWITFNGEIYNYRELRRELEGRGVAFHTATDTEVLLAAYETFGPGCLGHLRGMFAFAIWDTHERQLFIARDRVGKKPLFYRTDRDGIAFASESKAFFADDGFEARPDFQALSAYLSLQYVPAPWSAFAGVHALPPAHYLVATAQGTTVTRYWQLAYGPKLAVDEREAEEAVLAKLREAVRLRLISDVPLGAFLSGGVDSSVVVALMCELGGQGGRVKTFSIGFDEAEFNELPYARLVAQHYGTEHHEFVVRPEAHQILPELVWQYGEPFADSSAIPTWYLSRLTREHVTVALNGDGGDENFAGYDRYAVNARNAAYDRLPAWFRRAVAAGVSALPSERRRALARLRRWARVHALPDRDRLAAERLLIDVDTKARLCTADFLRAAGREAALDHLGAAYSATPADDPLDRQLGMDAQTYLSGALMPKVDIATMAFGLEGRSPLLDHEVMELAARLPVHLKRRDGEGKRLLRRLASRLVPRAAIDRPKKGFSVPLVRWFRAELAEVVGDVLLGAAARHRGIYDGKAVERLVLEHRRGRCDWSEQIWILLMLELWAQTYLDSTPRPRPRTGVGSLIVAR